ncbi:TPA: fimbrial protein [Vibrio parahaemolyticus]
MYKNFLFLSVAFISTSILAKEVTGELVVKGIVKNPTCIVDAPAEEVSLGSYTPRQLINGSVNEVSVSVGVDCGESYKNGEFRGIYLNLTPLPSSPPVGSTMPSTMQTNLQGVGVKLAWDYNFGKLEFGQNINGISNNTGVFNINLKSKLVAIGSGDESTIERGTAKAGMVISLSYF